MSNYDITIIGGGPGGYVAAIRAAQLGAKVALIEKDQVGGTCLNRGCIPTKAIIACVNLYEKIQQAANFGLSADNIKIDLPRIIERKNTIAARIVKGVEFLLEKNKVEVIRGRGEVLEPGTVAVGNQKHTCKSIILAVGSSPIELPGCEFNGEKYLSSAQALGLKEVPAEINIVGGGVIGIEFAGLFAGLGSRVNVYEVLPEILGNLDEEIVAQLKRILKRKKVNILTGTKFTPDQAVGKNLICIGRRPNLPNIKVNEKLETAQTGIYAVGDLVSSSQLAHVAYEQGVIAAENALGKNKTFTYDFVPHGIYTHPEIAGVGLTEKEAREKYQNIKVGKFPYAALGIAQAMGEIEGFIKVISDEKGKLLGVHIIGAEATSLIGAATLALKTGLSTEQLAATFQSHPSYPEGLHEAALSTLTQSLHSIN